MNTYRTLEEQLEDWKNARAEAEKGMNEAFDEHDRMKYKCCQQDYERANQQITTLLGLINEAK